MSKWKRIEIPPDGPLQAELFFGRMPKSFVIAPYRDERRQMGFWCDGSWHHMGTGHRINEFGDEPVECIPTHYRPLPTPPDAP